MNSEIVTPTTFEGEVLDYEGRAFVVIPLDGFQYRIPIPPEDVRLFDAVPLGATVSMDFATVNEQVDFGRLLTLRVKDNVPGASWRTLKQTEIPQYEQPF
jgi:hypothetical protein